MTTNLSHLGDGIRHADFVVENARHEIAESDDAEDDAGSVRHRNLVETLAIQNLQNVLALHVRLHRHRRVQLQRRDLRTKKNKTRRSIMRLSTVWADRGGLTER